MSFATSRDEVAGWDQVCWRLRVVGVGLPAGVTRSRRVTPSAATRWPMDRVEGSCFLSRRAAGTGAHDERLADWVPRRRDSDMRHRQPLPELDRAELDVPETRCARACRFHRRRSTRTCRIAGCRCRSSHTRSLGFAGGAAGGGLRARVPRARRARGRGGTERRVALARGEGGGRGARHARACLGI